MTLTFVDFRLEDSSPRDADSPGIPGTERISLDELSRSYSDLESEARYRVMSSMDRILGQVSEDQKQEYLCAVMKVRRIVWAPSHLYFLMKNNLNITQPQDLGWDDKIETRT